MPAVRTLGILFIALAAACAGPKEAPSSVRAQSGPPIVEPTLLGPNQDAAIAAELPQPVVTGDAAVETEPVAGTPAPLTLPSRSQSATKAVPAPAKAPVKVSAAPAAIEQSRKNEDLPAAARKPEPQLDVAGLTARLRDTNAIGVFTKLALKNQVDDLLKQFRAHYQSGQKTGVASLRLPYDMLVLKVLALLQDSDPSLARTISGSREAIWGILVDRDKFNSIT